MLLLAVKGWHFYTPAYVYVINGTENPSKAQMSVVRNALTK